MEHVAADSPCQRVPASTTDSRFSVLMSLYRKENPAYLDKCFESLSGQTLAATEIIVVLDGPLPTSLLDVVLDWSTRLPIKTVPLAQNMGLGIALASGLQACCHELIARMDTDDLCVRTRFQKQMAFMAANPEIALCGSFIQEFDPDSDLKSGIRTVPLSNSDILRYLPRRNPFNHMTVMFKKSAVLAVGSYQHFPLMEDWYLWARLAKAGYTVANLPECLVLARAGATMVARRGGINYVKSEYSITRFFIKSGLASSLSGWTLFCVRSLTRLLPSRGRRVIYKLMRR